MESAAWRTRVGAALVAIGIAGIVLAWLHYPPHQHPLEGLFSRSWPQSPASSGWDSLRIGARLLTFCGVLVFGGARPANLFSKGSLLWLAVAGALLGVWLLTPIGPWPLILWVFIGGACSWISSAIGNA
jgi:hypothetical protein